MNASKSNAGRLVMTESAYFSSAAQKDCFDDLGVEEYEIVATLDAHTSEICQSMDGKHFPLKDFQAGVTAPPFHPWCRSTTCPYFDDDYGEVGERAARGGDGKTYFVPADMNYREWKETFVDGGDKEVLAAIDKSENGGIINVGSDNVTSKSWFEEKNSIDFNDEQSVTKALLNFEDMYANSDREHCIVISTSGKVYEVHGEKWAVDTSVLGYELKGSINEHNHVFGESHYSFSREDLFSSIDDGSAIVYAFDEKYRYMMDFRDTDISEEQVHIAYRAAVEEVNEIKFFEYISGNITLNFDNEQHEIIKRTCERLGVVYERHEK